MRTATAVALAGVLSAGAGVGVLLTPATADGMAEILAGGPVPEALVPFSPGRFAAPQK